MASRSSRSWSRFAIAALLLTLALPQYSTWLADNQVRNGAQSVSEGLRAAQAAAISRNINAQIISTASTAAFMQDDSADTLQTLQTASFNEGSQRVTFVGVDAANNPATKAAFNSLGQVLVPTPPAVNTNIVKVDVTFPRLDADAHAGHGGKRANGREDV